MFFIGKILSPLLQPFIWVVVAVIIALFTKDSFRKRRRLVFAGLIAYFFSNYWIIAHLFLAWQPARQEFIPMETYETGILLGGYAGFDATDGLGYFNHSSDRFLETVRLYKSGHIRKILLTGANGQLSRSAFIEADFAKATLLEMGVPASDILTERRSRNTIENAAFSRMLLDSLGITGKQALITSAMHMPRAAMIFRNAGIDIRPYPCAYMVVPDDGHAGPGSLMPSSHAYELWDIYLRERVGYLVAALRK